MARLNFESCVTFRSALFLLASRVLLASPNFGQAKHGQKGPAATFRHFSKNQRPVQARPVNDRTRPNFFFDIYLQSCFEISGSDGNNLKFRNSNRRTNTTGRDMLKFVNLLLFLSLHELKIHEVKASMSSLEVHILMEGTS